MYITKSTNGQQYSAIRTQFGPVHIACGNSSLKTKTPKTEIIIAANS